MCAFLKSPTLNRKLFPSCLDSTTSLSNSCFDIWRNAEGSKMSWMVSRPKRMKRIQTAGRIIGGPNSWLNYLQIWETCEKWGDVSCNAWAPKISPVLTWFCFFIISLPEVGSLVMEVGSEFRPMGPISSFWKLRLREGRHLVLNVSTQRFPDFRPTSYQKPFEDMLFVLDFSHC